MKKATFIDYVNGLKPYMRQACEPLDLKKISKEIYNRYIGMFDVEKLSYMASIFSQVGSTTFFRNELKSKDELFIDLHWTFSACIWDDLNILVNKVGVIRNCAGIIETIYISELGKYYNHNHDMIADCNELLFDYLSSTEYNFHPVIEERTFTILKSNGWHENRYTDTSLFYRYMSDMGVVLTEKQLKVISEFNGLHYTSEAGYFEFYSINELCEFELEFLEKAEWHGENIGCNVLEIGQSSIGKICVDSNGVLLNSGSYPIGRTLMECIQSLVNSIYQFDR